MGKQAIIGVVSDTHGSLPDSVLEVFSGRYDNVEVVAEFYLDGTNEDLPTPRKVDCIVHAGDIGELTPLSQEVIDKLEQVAPVHAVLGKRDEEGYTASGAPLSWQPCRFEACGVEAIVIHKPEDLRVVLKRIREQPRLQIYGHTHEFKLRRIGNRLMMCPGAIQRPKGDWPVRTVGLVFLEEPGKIIGAQILKV